ncbi:branched-chain amino acid ABC transporter permease [Siccirubricoccus sp. KC 17139]|uniref:Branched-chain amino acid ABC transporter permease n=1 Tax=Siccirubricoccus soli TaxID=2899147 RepID=A0ABT1CZC5_9PROT|nr:branched-chain amino acid ABC transporter permease [Siccirubricoccus soli]MCO6415025.1 branched-chain amino acid ABC transporter permease [Siccirubricoccus soli]MCP2681156.1 branched-chain amino acid ABC transporter permease [Siccirubricoccus soli]
MKLPLLPILLLVLLAGVPLLSPPDYFMHLLITALLTAVMGTGWAMMGRFGLVSFGHGAFLGASAYTMALLWNELGITPWLGIPVGVLVAVLLGVLLGYPCFRLRVVGHYFALVTLAAGEIVRILVTALREHTGGSLGMTPNQAPPGGGFLAMQFDKAGFWWVALGAWGLALLAWWLLDRSMTSKALAAIAEDEDAAASVGIQVTREKLKITVISVAFAALAGALMAQYRMYLNPESLSGLGISLQIVFSAIAGGMYAPFGPSIGAVITIGLEEALRFGFGTEFTGGAPLVYGVLLVLFMLFLPRGIAGLLERRPQARKPAAPAVQLAE